MVAGWEGSMEIRIDKKELKVKGQQPQKKVDYGVQRWFNARSRRAG